MFVYCFQYDTLASVSFTRRFDGLTVSVSNVKVGMKFVRSQKYTVTCDIIIFVLH